MCDLISFPEIFLNSVRIPSLKYRLGHSCANVSWKARSIRSPLETDEGEVAERSMLREHWDPS